MENTGLTNEQKAAIREAAILMGKDPYIIERAVEENIRMANEVKKADWDELKFIEQMPDIKHFQHTKRPLTEERKQWKKKLHKLMKA